MACQKGVAQGLLWHLAGQSSASSRAYYMMREFSQSRSPLPVAHLPLMNVTQLQQPPPQPVSPRPASEAEDITPDVCCLFVAWNRCTHTSLAVLVDKTGQ